MSASSCKAFPTGKVKMLRIHVFHTGSVRVDRAIPFGERNPLAVTGLFRGKDKKLILPVSCYLVEHEKDLVLFDTGWDKKYVHEKPKEMLGLLEAISGPLIKEGESVDCQLSRLGIKPCSLDWVVLSHLDFDHVSGLPQVKDAKHIIASQEEIEAAGHPSLRYVPALWKGVDIKPFPYEKTGIGPVGMSHDLFHDGLVLLISTPGHSEGLCSMMVRNDVGDYVLLAADVGYAERSWKEDILPGFTVDKKKAEASLSWVRECANDKHCLAIMANHDPHAIPQVIDLWGRGENHGYE